MVWGAAGGEADADVTDRDGGGVRKAAGGCDADDGADGVVTARGVGVGHEGGLAADDGHAGVAASRGHALDQRGQNGWIEAVGGHVVEESNRAGVLDGHVVEAVVDEVASGIGRAAHLNGQMELGADAVDAGDDGRVGDVRGEADHAAEAAEGVQREGSGGGGDGGTEAGLGALGQIKVDAGLRVAGDWGVVHAGGRISP